MLHLPHGGREWLVAIVSALVGFFFGGAMVAWVQAIMRRALGL
jgi:hypothetical protein